MRLWKAAIPALALGVLAGCVSKAPAPAPAPAPIRPLRAAPPPAPPPPPEAGKDWGFSAASADEPAKLVYGTPGTDDVDLLFWCAAPRHAVEIQPVGADDQKFAWIEVRSGPTSLKLPLKPYPERGDRAAVALGDPLLAAFAASGRLEVDRDDGARETLDAQSPPGRAHISAFFAACR